MKNRELGFNKIGKAKNMVALLASALIVAGSLNGCGTVLKAEANESISSNEIQISVNEEFADNSDMLVDLECAEELAEDEEISTFLPEDEEHIEAGGLEDDVDDTLVAAATKENNIVVNNTAVTEKVSVAHSHSYSIATYLDATCDADGVITYSCSCGDSYTDYVWATGHDFGNNQYCSKCSAINPNYVEPHTHNYTVEASFTLGHTNEGHYAPYICECRLDFQTYEELEAHQEETAIASRDAYRDENGVWHGDITHGGWCNGWVVEREWDVYAVCYKEVCECGAVGNEWHTVEEVECTCIHYGPDMHFHFADRECCSGQIN